MLIQRRHELGLTILQASHVLKLKEQVLTAFEEGDWENMPQSGYASGMLASYARYLGLNPREVVDVYQEELYEHIHGTSSHELRRRTRDTQSGRGIAGYDVVNEAGSRPKAYVEYRTLLPTSGGPAGDMGAFATTSSARARGASANVPLAGQRREAASSASPYSHSAYVSGHPYNTGRAASTRDEGGSTRSASSRSGAARQRRRRDNDPSYRLLRTEQNLPGDDEPTRPRRTQRLHGDVTTRGVRPSEYQDDMRYDDSPHPYERASSVDGRRSSRNIASTDRPNVQRRAVRDTRNTRRRRRGGVAGAVDGFLSDGGRAILLIVVVLAAVLTIILITSVSSCVRSQAAPEGAGGRTVAVTSTSDESKSSSGGDSQDSQGSSTATKPDTTRLEATDDTSGEKDADTKTTTTSNKTTQEVKETKVAVTVASGEVSWLEVLCDGESKVADAITGPWSETYTVTDSITIQVADPDAVSVTSNGEKVTFDSKTGGVWTTTIQGTPAADASSDGTSATGTATSGGSGSSANSGTGTSGTGSTSSTSSTGA